MRLSGIRLALAAFIVVSGMIAVLRDAAASGEDTASVLASLDVEEQSAAADVEALPATMTLSFGDNVGMTLQLIPAGVFEMGSPMSESGRRLDERRRTVRIIRPFYLGTFEVTQEQYTAVMGEDPSWFKGAGRPVEWVTWDEAAEFCRRLSRETGKEVRLPAEVEWEYACRAGTTTPFSFGNYLLPGAANFKAASTRDEAPTGVYRRRTTRAGSFRPNAWGLYDMHGNVMEWCADRYVTFPGRYSGRDLIATRRPDSPRVLRGGSWRSNSDACRSAARFHERPDESYADIGFRVAVTIR
jgi:formylglycine-generating enzyme required for sulfatase activity